MIVDSASSAIKVITVKKKRQTKKAKKLNVKDKPVVNKALETKNIDSSSNNNRPIIIVVVAIVLISVLAYSVNSDDLDPGIPGDVDPLFLRA